MQQQKLHLLWLRLRLQEQVRHAFRRDHELDIQRDPRDRSFIGLTLLDGYWVKRASFTALILEPALELLDRRVA
jgi:hypothetical protein